MIDREKVLHGLSSCGTDYGIPNICEVTECPYREDKAWCVHGLAHDAGMLIAELLKAQEPRVIRFDEINNYEVLWLEVRDVETEDGLAPWVKIASGRWFSPLLCSEVQPDMILSTPDEYGKICRCWTSRPTEEQREAEPWD